MDSPLFKLTLVYPPAGADRIVELMLTIDPPLAGFTTWTVEGHGFGFSKASVSERVRGRVNREILEAIMPHRDALNLLQRIATEAPIPHTTYWIEPVSEFGHLTRSLIGGARP